MNLQDLRYLVAVAEHRHFGRAAEACDVSQPTLSNQIRKLEEELGVTLLERTNKRVHLTPVGSQILLHADRALAETRAMEDVARSARDPLVGPLRLGVIPTLAPYLMPLILKPLKEAYPGLTIELWEDQTRALIESLRNHKLDAALLATAAKSPEITEIDLFDEPLLAALPLQHALSTKKPLEEIALADELLVLAEGHCLANQALAACGSKHGVRSGLQGSMQAATLETLVNLVAAGYGVTLIPSLASETLGQRSIRHRRLAWTSVFEQMEFSRWLDSKQQDNFMRDVERDSTIPFTAENIKATLENVFMSRKKLFDESVARVFDELCSHAVENGSGPVNPLKNHWSKGEGWKTNDNYKINQKLIFPYGISFSYGSFNTYGRGEAMTIYADLDRILCVLDGKPFDQCYTVGAALDRAARGAKTGGMFESEYFEGRFFKKGTVHLKWKRLDLWEKFNLTAAAGKKWLGENTQQYRPTKRKTGADIPWECRETHNFVDGVCTRCKEPQVDELEAVECEWCRAIFEHTGVQHCPIHQAPMPTLFTESPLMLEAAL